MDEMLKADAECRAEYRNTRARVEERVRPLLQGIVDASATEFDPEHDTTSRQLDFAAVVPDIAAACDVSAKVVMSHIADIISGGTPTLQRNGRRITVRRLNMKITVVTAPVAAEAEAAAPDDATPEPADAADATSKRRRKHADK